MEEYADEEELIRVLEGHIDDIPDTDIRWAQFIVHTIRYPPPNSKGARWTVFYCACSLQNFHLTKLLLQRKANVNSQNCLGRTPLHLLLLRYMINIPTEHNNILRCVQLLLDHRANVNIQDKYGMSCPFYMIQKRGQKKRDMMQLLLNSTTFDLKIQLQKPFGALMIGDTILHCAVRKRNIEIVQMIIMECCSTSTPDLLLIRNSNNETAYDIAYRLNHKPIIECLKITLQLQCHLYLRQKWIMQINHNNNPITTVPVDDEMSSSSRKRQRKDDV